MMIFLHVSVSNHVHSIHVCEQFIQSTDVFLIFQTFQLQLCCTLTDKTATAVLAHHPDHVLENTPFFKYVIIFQVLTCFSPSFFLSVSRTLHDVAVLAHSRFGQSRFGLSVAQLTPSLLSSLLLHFSNPRLWVSDGILLFVERRRQHADGDAQQQDPTNPNGGISRCLC